MGNTNYIISIVKYNFLDEDFMKIILLFMLNDVMHSEGCID